MFVIRAKLNNGIHPGKWVFGNTAWVPWGGSEHLCNEFEIYVGALKWVDVKDKYFPPNMVEAGHEATLAEDAASAITAESMNQIPSRCSFTTNRNHS
ncbi:DM9 repeat-containing protein [Enterobacter hormaechei]|uniref:DM9 repeat-containing protein n=1 Tax=Enterobacter hormaechei TaxID=158836 RepID=UPI001651B2D7|nr:DM9 repeat-containing protein [Enterobacter hormaechei]